VDLVHPPRAAQLAQGLQHGAALRRHPPPAGPEVPGRLLQIHSPPFETLLKMTFNKAD